MVVEEIKQVIPRVKMYLEHLQLQLNMLLLVRLAPSTITPQNLKALFKQIENELEPPLRLTVDSERFVRSGWCFDCYLSGVETIKNGVAILFNTFEYKIFEVFRDPDGSYII